MAEVEYLFVYGTLKQGYSNNKRLLGNSKFLGRACSVKKAFRLYADGIPFLLESANNWLGNKIIGELYEVTPETLSRCDQLEGHPLFYCREKHLFVLTSGFVGANPPVYEAWVYIYQHPERFIDNHRDWVQPDTTGVVEW